MLEGSDIKKYLGSNVKKRRKALKLTQEKLAERTGLDLQSIKAIETGRVFVSAESLASLSNCFTCEPDNLLKLKPIEHFAKDTEIKREIDRILSGFDSDELLRMYKIAVALKK